MLMSHYYLFIYELLLFIGIVIPMFKVGLIVFLEGDFNIENFLKEKLNVW